MHRCSLLVGLSWTGKEWPHGCALCVFFSKSLILSKDKFTSMCIYIIMYIYIYIYVCMSNWKSIAIQHTKPQPPSPPPPCCHAPCWGLPATHRGAWRRETGHCFQHGVVHHLRPAAASCVICSLSLGAVLTGCPWKNCKWRLLKVNQSKRSTKDHKRQKWCFCRCTVVTHQFRNLVVFEPYHGKMIPFIFGVL